MRCCLRWLNWLWSHRWRVLLVAVLIFAVYVWIQMPTGRKKKPPMMDPIELQQPKPKPDKDPIKDLKPVKPLGDDGEPLSPPPPSKD